MTTPGRKVHHWKHGWIPLDAYSRAIVAEREKKALREGADARQRARATAAREKDPAFHDRITGILDAAQAKAEAKKQAMADAHAAGSAKIIKTNLMGNGPPEPHHAHLERVEGTPVDFLVDPPPENRYGNDYNPNFNLTRAREREAAGVAKDMWDRFPGLKTESPGIVDGTVLMKGTKDSDSPFAEEPFATTDAGHPPFLIELHSGLYDNEHVQDALDTGFANGGAIEGEADNPREMRKMAVAHELGHYIMARNEYENGMDPGDPNTTEGGPIDDFTMEPVTPREMGYTSAYDPNSSTPPPPEIAAQMDASLDEPTPRWTADGLRRPDVSAPARSAYGTQNKWEWFAEAFLDGYWNGDQASETGKRAVALVEKLYGDPNPPPKPYTYLNSDGSERLR